MDVRDLAITKNWIQVTLIPYVFMVKDEANKMQDRRRWDIRYNIKALFYITLQLHQRALSSGHRTLEGSR